jgi:tetratricopeptide (TPR) repeat protein
MIDHSSEQISWARHLHRAGQWDHALQLLDDVPEVAALRAEIAVDRYWWQLDAAAGADAREAVAALSAGSPLRDLLEGLLRYTRLVFGREPRQDDAYRAAASFAAAAADPAIHGWARFWQGVLADNIRRDRATAAARYSVALEVANTTQDLFLESYVVRHQAAHLLRADRERAIALFRRSLHLRAALGARPQVAAAQAALADALPAGKEADLLRELARHTAGELRLTWLAEALSRQGVV